MKCQWKTNEEIFLKVEDKITDISMVAVLKMWLEGGSDQKWSHTVWFLGLSFSSWQQLIWCHYFVWKQLILTQSLPKNTAAQERLGLELLIIDQVQQEYIKTTGLLHQVKQTAKQHAIMTKTVMSTSIQQLEVRQIIVVSEKHFNNHVPKL